MVPSGRNEPKNNKIKIETKKLKVESHNFFPTSIPLKGKARLKCRRSHEGKRSKINAR